MKDSYTLDDFSAEDWIDRPEYREYLGISLEHLKKLHPESELHIFDGHVAFVVVDARQCFAIWLYEIVTWDHKRYPDTASPSFIVFGRTWEGITEVKACPADSPLPSGIITQMQWVERFVKGRGWDD